MLEDVLESALEDVLENVLCTFVGRCLTVRHGQTRL